MEPATAIAIALLTIAGSLSGVYFGWRLGMSERMRQWRRDKQIDAYAELIAAGADSAIAAHHEVNALTAEQRSASSAESLAAGIRFHNALHRAVLVASSGVRPVIDQLGDANRAALVELNKADRDRQELEVHIVHGADLRKALSAAARKDLGFE